MANKSPHESLNGSNTLAKQQTSPLLLIDEQGSRSAGDVNTESSLQSNNNNIYSASNDLGGGRNLEEITKTLPFNLLPTDKSNCGDSLKKPSSSAKSKSFHETNSTSSKSSRTMNDSSAKSIGTLSNNSNEDSPSTSSGHSTREKDSGGFKKLFTVFTKQSKKTQQPAMQIGAPVLLEHKGFSSKKDKKIEDDDLEAIANMIKNMVNNDKFITAVKMDNRYTTDDDLDDSEVSNVTTDSNRTDRSEHAVTSSGENFLDHSNNDKQQQPVAAPRIQSKPVTSPQVDELSQNSKDVSPNIEQKPVPQKPPRTMVTVKLTDQEVIEKLRALSGADDPKTRFKSGTLVGAGASAKVYSYLDTFNENQMVAMKVLSLKEQKKKEYVISEIQVMRKIQHPNIVNLIDCYLTEDARFLKIVMEFLWNSLTNVILNWNDLIPEQHTAYTSREVFRGLAYLHDKNIIHRDIKSDNVLLGKDGSVKLADFGFCAELTNADMQRKTQLGTPYWMSPEIARRESYTPRVDVWSVGIMIIEMIDTSPPYMEDEFYARSPLEAIRQIGKLSEPPPIKRIERCSKNLKQFVYECLTVDARCRPDAVDLLDHEYLKESSDKQSFAEFLESVNLDDEMS